MVQYIKKLGRSLFGQNIKELLNRKNKFYHYSQPSCRCLDELFTDSLPNVLDHECFSHQQELRSREEELTRATLQQKSHEELLKRREQQLAEREINVLERELNILIFQLNKDKPNVKKRKGKFKRSRLKLKDGNRISLPSG